MNRQDPVRSVLARLWSSVASTLGLVIATNTDNSPFTGPPLSSRK